MKYKRINEWSLWYRWFYDARRFFLHIRQGLYGVIYYIRNWYINHIYWRDVGINIEWCSLCQSGFSRCPLCGNNSCNGGYGEVNGKECPMCEYVYEFERSL